MTRHSLSFLSMYYGNVVARLDDAAAIIIEEYGDIEAPKGEALNTTFCTELTN